MLGPMLVGTARSVPQWLDHVRQLPPPTDHPGTRFVAHTTLSPCAPSDLPDGRSFSCPATDDSHDRLGDSRPESPRTQPSTYKGASDGTHRSPGTDQELGDAAGGGHVRPPGRSHPARLRSDHRLVDPAHPGSPRTGCRTHGRGLRTGDRPAGRGHRHQRARGHQHRDPAGRRLHGLDPAGGGDRSGGHHRDRHRRVPGERHHRHHHGDHQAQLADHRWGRHPPGGGRGIPRGHHRATGSGPHRHPQGRGQQTHGVVLARRFRPRPPRVPPDDRGGPGTGAPRPPSCCWPPSVRSSTPAGGSSRPAPPNRCASWPSGPASRWSPP